MLEGESQLFKPEIEKTPEQKNIFLKGPESISSKEEQREEELTFIFGSKTREYRIGIKGDLQKIVPKLEKELILY